MTSIIVLLPYFGSKSDLFSFWLTSCRNNPTIDWVVIADFEIDCDVSANVTSVFMTFEAFADRARKYFPFEISLNRPYKLCDFKPFYGLILSQYTQGYDFWGYCDCDLIFGNIRKFATEEILGSCDKFLGHGHFSLQRTADPDYQYLLENARSSKYGSNFDYRQVLCNESSFAFDEYDHQGISYWYLKIRPNRIYTGHTPNHAIYDDLNKDLTHFSDVIKDKNKQNTHLYRYTNGTLERVVCHSGTVTSEEIIYVHFLKRSMCAVTSDTQKYLIVPNRFIPFTEELSADFIHANAGIRFIDLRKVKSLMNRARARLKLGTRLRKLQPNYLPFYSMSL